MKHLIIKGILATLVCGTFLLCSFPSYAQGKWSIIAQYGVQPSLATKNYADFDVSSWAVTGLRSQNPANPEARVRFPLQTKYAARYSAPKALSLGVTRDFGQKSVVGLHLLAGYADKKFLGFLSDEFSPSISYTQVSLSYAYLAYSAANVNFYLQAVVGSQFIRQEIAAEGLEGYETEIATKQGPITTTTRLEITANGVNIRIGPQVAWKLSPQFSISLQSGLSYSYVEPSYFIKDTDQNSWEEFAIEDTAPVAVDLTATPVQVSPGFKTGSFYTEIGLKYRLGGKVI